LTYRIAEIYTDGSCHTQQKAGAWAAIIHMDGKKTILKGTEGSTTHNRMELLAVIKAIEHIVKQQNDTELIIYTDSQYVCGLPGRKEKLIEQKFLTRKGKPIQNADLVQTLFGLMDKVSTQYIKVKAHQSEEDQTTKYNNLVDKLSRKMVREQCTDSNT
jgi:ribonuclease HI